MNEKKYDFFADRTEEKLKKAEQINLLKKEQKEKVKQKIIAIIKKTITIGSFIIGGVILYYSANWFAHSLKEAKIEKQQAIVNEVINNVQSTQKLWGDLYLPTNDLMNKYQVKSILVDKKKTYYNVDITMDNGEKLERSYPFFQKPSIQGFKDNLYSYKLERQKMPDGKFMMVSWGVEKIWDQNKADKAKTESNFIPEVQYIIKRAGQSNMWGQMSAYRKASYSASELKAYMEQSPIWMKEDSSEMLSFIIEQVNIPESFYQSDRANTAMMVEMLKGYGAKADKNQVCQSYEKLFNVNKNMSEIDNKFFTILLDGKNAQTECAN